MFDDVTVRTLNQLRGKLEITVPRLVALVRVDGNRPTGGNHFIFVSFNVTCVTIIGWFGARSQQDGIAIGTALVDDGSLRCRSQLHDAKEHEEESIHFFFDCSSLFVFRLRLTATFADVAPGRTAFSTRYHDLIFLF